MFTNDSGKEYAGRIRMTQIPAASRPQIEQLILDAVEPGTWVRTDGLNSYRSIHGLGYAHDPIVVSRTRGTRSASAVAAATHATAAYCF
jgi:hypothetical protein